MEEKEPVVILVTEDDEVRAGVISFVLSQNLKKGDLRLDVKAVNEFLDNREEQYPGMGKELEKFVYDELVPAIDKITAIVDKYESRLMQ